MKKYNSMGLGSYNKYIIPLKQNFYVGFQDSPLKQDLTKEYRNFLNKLSFNLDFNSNNYRYGQRYFNNDSDSLSWITTNENKCLIKTFYDKNEFRLNQYEQKIYITDDKLEKHLYSWQEKNRIINKYYKYDKEFIEENKTSLQNLYKITKGTIGCTQQSGTNILLLDIDNDIQWSSLEKLWQFLKLFELKLQDLLYIEQNIFTGGIHTGIVLPHKITNNEFYSYLESYLKEEGIRIECNFQNKIYRLPLSYEYIPIKKDERIFGCYEFIYKDFYHNSFKEFVKSINFKKSVKSELLNEIINKFREKKPYEDYWKGKKKLFKRNVEHKEFKPMDFYTIERGERFNTMSKLIPYAKMCGYSLDETVELIRNQNISSKDLTKWSYDKLKNNIKSFYNKCNHTQIIKPESTDKFFSNLHLLKDNQYKLFDDDKMKNHLTRMIEHYYIQERRKHNNGFKDFSNEKKLTNNIIIPIMIKEIIGYMIYSINDNKEFINKSYNKYLGFQLSDQYLNKLMNHIITINGLNKDSKLSIQYLKRAIIRFLKLNEIKYNRKRNWMLGCCKSYYIKTIEHVANIIMHIYNSCYNNMYINKFILNNLLNILYILLEEKRCLERYFRYFFDCVYRPDDVGWSYT